MTLGRNEPAFSVKWCKCISGEAENSGEKRTAGKQIRIV